MPGEKIGDRRFALAAPPHERDTLADRDVEGDAVEHERASPKTESDTLEPNGAIGGRHRPRVGTVVDVGRRVEKLIDAAQRDARGRDARDQPHQRLDGRKQAHLVRQKRHESTKTQLSRHHSMTAV